MSATVLTVILVLRNAALAFAGGEHTREVLAQLYDSTGGPGWVNNANWMTNESINTWYGVNSLPCDVGINEQVCSINLQNNNLVGTIPPSLFSLPTLSGVWLGYNEFLGGQLPTEIGNLGSSLKSIFISHCSLSGTLPTQLNRLTELSSLSLDNNDLSGPLIDFTNVNGSFAVMIRLENNKLSGPISPTLFSTAGAPMSFLSLSLSNNEISGNIPKELDHLGNFTILLDDNNITGIADQLCDNRSWMDLAVGEFGCNAILCPNGTYRERDGRQTSNATPCLACDREELATYFGTTTCPVVSKATQTLDSISVSFAMSLIATVALLAGATIRVHPI